MVDCFAENLAVLQVRYAEIAQRLQTRPCPSLPIEISRSGQATLKRGGKLLHSAYDPVAEAAAFVRVQDIHPQENVIVLGFALGYHVVELFRQNRSINTVVIIEPEWDLFHQALMLNDFREFLAHREIIFCVGMSPLEIMDCLSSRAVRLMSSRTVMVEHPGSVQWQAAYYAEVRERVLDSLRTAAASVATVNKLGQTMLENVFGNLSAIVRSPGIRVLRGAFPGIPAFIISTGPSLDKNIQELAAAQDHALLLCTDTAFPRVRGAGIRPDLVLTMDYKAESRRHFEGVRTDDVPLLFDMEAAPAAVAAYAGGTFVSATSAPLPFWINSLCGDKGIIDKGLSVAHFAFAAAVVLGCEPIIFIGQDLAFTGGVTHASGTRSRCESRRYDNGRLLRMRSELTGESCETSLDMYIYLRHFEKLVAASHRRCINATEGGAGIRGTQPLSAAAAVATYCVHSVPIRERIHAAQQTFVPVDNTLLPKGLSQQRELVRRVRNASVQIVEILEELFVLSREAIPQSQQVGILWEKLKPLSRVVSEEELLLRIMHPFIMESMMAIEHEGGVQPGECRSGCPPAAVADDLKHDYALQKGVQRAADVLELSLDSAMRQFSGQGEV